MLIFICTLLCVLPVCVPMHCVQKGAPRSQRRASESWSHGGSGDVTWILGTKLGYSARTANASNYRTTSSSPAKTALNVC